MSSTFSFSRLGKLITKQFFENSRLYLFSILALIGLLSLVFGFWFLAAGPRYDERETYNIYISGLFVAGTIFASMGFHMLASKDKGIYWLGVPATHLEKLICTILFSTLLFTIVYTLCFLLVKTIGVSLIEGFINNHPGTTYEKVDIFEKGAKSHILYFLYAYFAVQSLYLLGSVYFPRYSFIVTTVAGALIIFVFVYYVSELDDKFMEGFAWNIVSARKAEGTVGGYFLYSVSPAVASICKLALQFAWAPVFWLVTWYRLKEKEL